MKKPLENRRDDSERSYIDLASGVEGASRAPCGTRRGTGGAGAAPSPPVATGGRREAPTLDLSLGHIGTTGIDAPLNPVHTREDCFSWLTFDEVGREVFGAFVGAQQHARKYDFGAHYAAAEPNDPDYVVVPGTVRFANDGGPAWDRSDFLEYMLAGIVWRLTALAERKGVDLKCFDLSAVLGSLVFKEKGFSDPYFSFLGGTVLSLSDADVAALPAAKRKAIKAAAKRAL